MRQLCAEVEKPQSRSEAPRAHRLALVAPRTTGTLPSGGLFPSWRTGWGEFEAAAIRAIAG